jgi:hypothetical protein
MSNTTIDHTMDNVNDAYLVICKTLGESPYNGASFKALQQVLMPAIDEREEYIKELEEKVKFFNQSEDELTEMTALFRLQGGTGP